MLCLQGRPGWQAPGLRGLGRRGVGFNVNLDFGEREVGSRPLGERSWLRSARRLRLIPAEKDVRTRALRLLSTILVTLGRTRAACPGFGCRVSAPLAVATATGPRLPKDGRPPPWGAGQGLVYGRPPAAHAPGRGRGAPCCTGRGWVSPSLRPQTAFGDERSTSQGSQPPPPGSPLSREEGEAPPPAPAEEGRRRSRRVRLRGSCRHRPSLLGRRELASSGPAGPATASSEMMASGAKEFKMDNFSPKAGTSKLQQTVPADASPDSKCPICLDRFDNVSYLDRCLHKFCFRCVQEWSKNKAECPLCKQPFDSIFHSVRAEDDFKEYVLRPSYNGSFTAPEVRRFRYRTTMTREREREQNASLYSSGTTINRRTTTPPDSGVLFEGLGISARPREVEIPQFMRQMALRRTATADERSLRKIQEQDIINFRRTLYRAGVRVRSIEDGGRYRDISAEFFRKNPACLHRLVPWLKRELTVLFGAHGSLVNIVQHIIMSNVTRYDLESQAFVSDLRPFLLNRTEHFIHEFISFARSPFNMAAFDQHANYDCPPSSEEGSHSDSSVITISPDETETQELDMNVSTVRQAPWDDETPGPSYSSSEQVHVGMSSLLNSSDSSDEELVPTGATPQVQGVQANDDLNNDSDSSSDNCVIVGFVKPLAERTPELVELSSDSEELGSYEKMEAVKTQEQEQSYSSDDSDVCQCSSPRSVLGKDEQVSKSHCDSDTRVKSKKEEKRSTSTPRDSSSTRGDRASSPYINRHRKRGRSRSSDSQSQSRSGHDQRNHRRHHGKKRMKSKRSRSRESSGRPRARRDKKRSRTRDSSWSRRSQTLSLSSGSTSRSRSRSSDHGKRRSRSRNRDRYYLRNNYGSKYKWEYTYYSRNKDRDGYESSYRKRTLSRARYSRQSSSPEFKIQSISERTNARKKNHSERKYYYYERHRSRSVSSSRSRTASTGPDRVRNEKPGGKRKYKTRHLEGTNEVAQQSRDCASKVKDSHYQKSSKLDGNYKNESDSLSDSRSSDRETKHKKRKRRTRSLSVEIVYEGKTTDATKHHKKKKKKHKKKHKKHHGDTTSRSPVVITIDSDSDKDPEVKAAVECSDGNLPQPLHSEVLTPSLEGFETRDVVTIEDEFGVLDKDCDVTALSDDLSTSRTLDNSVPPAVSVEQTLDVREESTFASDLESQSSNMSIQTEPSRPLSSPRTSLLSAALDGDCDMS